MTADTREPRVSTGPLASSETSNACSCSCTCACADVDTDRQVRDALAERVRKLERQNRRLKIGGTAALCLLAVGLALAGGYAWTVRRNDRPAAVTASAKPGDLNRFWEEMQALSESVAPPDVRMEFDSNAGPLDLIEALQGQMEGIRDFHDHIAESYRKLEPDLRNFLTRAGYDLTRLDRVPSGENPFVDRDWEWITMFPNRLASCRIAIAQLRARYLELLSGTTAWNDDYGTALDEAKQELGAALRAGVYVD